MGVTRDEAAAGAASWPEPAAAGHSFLTVNNALVLSMRLGPNGIDRRRGRRAAALLERDWTRTAPGLALPLSG
jgi:hypothetical protein